MARQSITELRAEIDKLRAQVEGVKQELENSLVLVLDMLDRVNETVAHRLRLLKIEVDAPLPDEDDL